MVKKQLFLFITIVVLVGALFFYSFLYISKLYTGIPDNLPSRTPLVEGKASQGVIVTRVIDGDTVVLENEQELDIQSQAPAPKIPHITERRTR